MIGRTEIWLRVTITLQLVAMGVVRAYFGAPPRTEPTQTSPSGASEPRWLTATLAGIAILHFGAVLAYLVNPSFLQWSSFAAGRLVRWIGLVISCFGMAGEIWAAVALGTSYSPTLRVADEHVVVTAGPYRWIRHPLYAFWLLVSIGWGMAACNWFILLSGIILIFVLAVIRVPREEAMMLRGFGESYGRYMTRTGRFLPRRSVTTQEK